MHVLLYNIKCMQGIYNFGVHAVLVYYIIMYILLIKTYKTIVQLDNGLMVREELALRVSFISV
jgi:hypothetical protein